LLDGSINAMDKSHVWLISVWPVQVQTVPLTTDINFARMAAKIPVFFFSTPEVKVYSKEIDEHKNLAIRMRNKKENGDKKREAMAIE
jgi:hypothetical protein